MTNYRSSAILNAIEYSKTIIKPYVRITKVAALFEHCFYIFILLIELT